jgi:hypothetical protein
MLRYKICVLFLFIFGIYSLTKVDAKVNNLPLLGKTIYLDAGHPS